MCIRLSWSWIAYLQRAKSNGYVLRSGRKRRHPDKAAAIIVLPRPSDQWFVLFLTSPFLLSFLLPHSLSLSLPPKDSLQRVLLFRHSSHRPAFRLRWSCETVIFSSPLPALQLFLQYKILTFSFRHYYSYYLYRLRPSCSVSLRTCCRKLNWWNYEELVWLRMLIVNLESW